MSARGKNKENIAGGSAVGGGISFQAAVTAIASIYMASGSKMGWLEGILDDIPTEILSETGGPGDDLKLCYRNASVAEIQVKKGLRQGKRLWDALVNLADAIKNKKIACGLLVVCPSSSESIRKDLSRDIHRIGDGRRDKLKKVSETFISKLEALGISPEEVCQRLRIITIHALENDSANINAARSELRHICADPSQIENAWDCIYKDSLKLIEFRGRRTVATVMQLLDSSRILLNQVDKSNLPISILSSLCEWVREANSSFDVLGISNPLPLSKAWLPLKTVVHRDSSTEQESITEALERYHGWERRSYDSDQKSIEPTSIGRFIKLCVVIAGPGMGKSTLLKKLASIYASEGYPVVKVRLPSLAVRMKNGGGFEEGLFSLGLDGSGLNKEDLTRSGIRNWVVLCDGLDECGASQKLVCDGLHSFTVGNPDCRVIVTTRPVGYSANNLKNWRHYELLPLVEDKADVYIHTLLSGVFDSSSKEFRDCLEFARAELKKTEANKIVARSPLLLGLAASLALRKADVGHSKVDLYKRLFQLIDNASINRADKPHVSKAKANRFLEVLGWVLFKCPTSSVDVVLEKCAETLGPELESSKLNAIAECETMVRYWEEVGLVETIRHAGEDTLTFIHKTFGEYAAARYIVAMPLNERREVIVSELSDDPDSEVLKFACSLGSIDLIAAEVIQRATESNDEIAWVKRALNFLGSSELLLESADRDRILDVAFDMIDSPRYLQSKGIAVAMLSVSRRYPEQVAMRAKRLISSEHSWIRLSAWVFVTNGGRSYYDFDELITAFESLPQMFEPGLRRSLLGGLVLSEESFSGIREMFVANAIREIVTQLPEGDADRVLNILTRDELVNTVGFSMSIRELLNDLGKEDLAKHVLGYFGNTQAVFGDEKFRRAEANAHRKILSALIHDGDNHSLELESSSEDQRFIQLAAFMDASQYWHVEIRDIWNWQKDKDGEPVREVFRGIIEIAGIDKTELSQEANLVLRRLADSEMCNEGYSSFYVGLDHVDIAVDLQGATRCGLDIQLLEKALYHKSNWIVSLAANLLANLDDPEALQEIVSRALKTGKGAALWAAAQIANGINMDLKQLLIERLKLPLVSGCQYLYRELAQFDVELDDTIEVVLRNGLMSSGPRTAEETTKVLAKLKRSKIKSLVPLMEEACRHWLNHEEPYPKGGGVVPPSPREELLSLLLSVDAVNDHDLIQYVSDPRSDVQRLAEKTLVKKLSESDSLNGEFIGAVVNGDIAPKTLAQALRNGMFLNATQIERIVKLLAHDDSRFRLASMDVLDTKYLSQEQITTWANKLSNDQEREIREKAAHILMT